MHNYCLHDAQANRIKVFNDGLLIEFDHGVYNVDKNGKEIKDLIAVNHINIFKYINATIRNELK